MNKLCHGLTKCCFDIHRPMEVHFCVLFTVLNGEKKGDTERRCWYTTVRMRRAGGWACKREEEVMSEEEEVNLC